MGVKSCSRTGCESIMVDTHIDKIGYVCHTCQTEFNEYLEKFNIKPRTEADIMEALEKFMTIPKRIGSGEVISVSEFFAKNTK